MTDQQKDNVITVLAVLLLLGWAAGWVYVRVRP